MHYVIYVGGGQEDKVETHLKKIIDESLCSSCFHPVRHMRKKIRGNWTNYYEKLIPGYVFITSEDIQGLYMELKTVPMLTKLLGKEGWDSALVVQTLSEREEQWLHQLTGAGGNRPAERGQQNPIVELSQVGFDENDQVVILSGPLKDMEGLVKKINLHRRVAEIEVELMGRTIPVHLGFELIGKTE